MHKAIAIIKSSVLSVSTSNLTASCTQGSNPPSQGFSVWNDGAGTLSYSISDNATWLSCSPTNGTSSGEHDSITVNYSAAGLATGTYSAVITVTASGMIGASRTVNVSLTVNTALPGVIVDNADVSGVTIVGTWTGTTSSPGYYGTNYLHDGNTGKGTKSVTFRPNLPKTGDYQIWVWYTAGNNRATNVPIDVVCSYSGSSGVWTEVVNQRMNGSQWNLLLTGGPFAAGTNSYVKIRTDGTSSGYVIADAVKFVEDSGPALSVSPTNLAVSCTQGSNPANQSFEVWNCGGAIMHYSISDNATWLSCSPTNGMSTGEHDTIAVNYSASGLAVGTYTATITVTADSSFNSPQTVVVTLTVQPLISDVIVDNADEMGVEIIGAWTGSTSSAGYWPTNYIHDGNTGKGTKSVRFRPNLPSVGNYEVSIWYTAGSNRATNVPMDIVYQGDSKTVKVNQRMNGSQWLVLGTNSFAAGTNGYIRIRTDGTTSGYVIVDAVRFKLVGGTLAAEANKVTSLASSSMGTVSVLDPIEVRTSDPEPDTNGWKAVDGNSETFWQGQTGAQGWWLALNYGKNVKAQDVEVKWAEDSATNLLLLGSEDAEQWYEVVPLLKEGPVTFGYLWLVLPEGEAEVAPKVSEIRVDPAE